MPEMTFTVEWPDGTVDPCYSPSLVMHDHLTIGEVLPVADFVDRSTVALDLAAERVQAKFGFLCTSAMAERDRIQERSCAFASDAVVRILDMQPPLPDAAPTAPAASAPTPAEATS